MTQRWNVAEPARWQVLEGILPHRAHILVLQLDFFQLTEGHMRCRKVLLWGFWAPILNETGPTLNRTAVEELLSPGQVTMFDGARLWTQQSSQVTNTQRKGVKGASFKFWNQGLILGCYMTFHIYLHDGMSLRREVNRQNRSTGPEGIVG